MFCRYLSHSALLPRGGQLLVALLYPIPSTGRPVLILSLPTAATLASFGNPSVDSGVGQGQPGHARGCSWCPHCSGQGLYLTGQCPTVRDCSHQHKAERGVAWPGVELKLQA